MIKRWLLIPWRIIKCALGIPSPSTMWVWDLGVRRPLSWLERWEYKLAARSFVGLQALILEEQRAEEKRLRAEIEEGEQR